MFTNINLIRRVFEPWTTIIVGQARHLKNLDDMVETGKIVSFSHSNM